MSQWTHTPSTPPLTVWTQILTLYAQRGIVEKHSKYAFYHPFSEAIASMACDLPNKILTSVLFNLTLYFMTNLRRTPSAFFTFYLFSFACVLTMSMVFRTIGALSRTLAQAMAPAAVFILALVIYTGFTVPIRDMHPCTLHLFASQHLANYCSQGSDGSII